jgi:hypothetical protein
MKVAIANKVLTITNQSGVEDTRNLVYGRYYYDPNAGYIEVTTITQEKIQLRADKITEFNGTAGTPAFASILTALLANIKA